VRTGSSDLKETRDHSRLPSALLFPSGHRGRVDLGSCQREDSIPLVCRVLVWWSEKLFFLRCSHPTSLRLAPSRSGLAGPFPSLLRRLSALWCGEGPLPLYSSSIGLDLMSVFGLVLVIGVMPVWRFILSCASSVGNRFNPLSCWCPWRTLAGIGLSQVSFNKLAGSGGDQYLVDVVLENRRGSGLKDKLAGSGYQGKFRAANLWSSYMAAKLGCCDLRLGWRPLHTPVQLLRVCVCNLLGGGPSSSKRRCTPFSGQVVLSPALSKVVVI
jgi:hypothetical protein